MDIDFSKLFTTKAQAVDFSERLNTIIDGLYTTNFDVEKNLAEQFGVQKKDAVFSLFRESNISPKNNTDVLAFFKKLQEQAQNVPIVSLVIAFNPTPQILGALSEWFFLNMHVHVLFDISVDHSLLGGAKITYNGKFKDYSLRALFDTVFQSFFQPAKPQTAAAPTQTHQTSSPVQPTKTAPTQVVSPAPTAARAGG